jgi:hypothetical protein
MADTKANDVRFVHPDYTKYFNQISLTRDVFEGVDSIAKYIYRLQREGDDSFINRIKNITLKNFIKRATEAFVGMIFRKQIEVTGFDDVMIDIFGKVDKRNNLNIFAREVTTNLIVDGKVFIALDTDIDGMSDPYAITYNRSQIINWRKNANDEYTMIVVKEVITEENGEFGSSYVNQYRVYKEDGNVDIYREDNGEAYLYMTIETEYDYIPLVAIELSDIPPLHDIAKLTIKHTNRTSIKDKYLDMCATPIPIVWSPDIDSEQDPTQAVYVIGADEGFVFNGTKDECDFEWRELEGTSIDKLQEDLNVIEEDITTGVIRASTSDNTTIKTATQAYYEASESANRVVVIANAVELGLNKAIRILADLANVDLKAEARAIINKDFNAIQGNSDSVRLLWEVYLQGGLSTETFLDSLSKFELIDIGSVRDEVARIGSDKFKLNSRVEDNNLNDKIDNRTLSALNKGEDE